MKAKKKEEKSDPKKSKNVQKLKSVINSQPTKSQVKDETGRLKVFTSMCNRSVSKKKSEDKQTSQSNKDQRLPSKNKDKKNVIESQKTVSLSLDKRVKQFFPSNHQSKSPLL